MLELTEQEYTDFFNQKQSIILLIRMIQLIIGSLVMFFILVNIIRKKLYVYNTARLFMWCCFFYLLGMLIVVFFKNNQFQFVYTDESLKNNEHYIIKALVKMNQSKELIWIGVQSFINLYFYDLGYFFAVLVSYNVHCVMNGNYRNFMRNVFKNWVFLLFLAFMLVMYIIPLLSIFVYPDFENEFKYCYGPQGFDYPYSAQGDSSKRKANLLLFNGFVSNPTSYFWRTIMIINMYICPLIMLIAHSIILLRNRKKVSSFLSEEYLNSKQQFLIKSGKLSFIVFIIQFLHFAKLFLGFMFPQYIFILAINFLFDFYPFPLLYFYFRYTKQKQGLRHGGSTILQEEENGV